MSIKNIRDYSNDESPNCVLIVGKSVLLAYIISIACLTIYAILLALTNLSETHLPTAVMVITIISIALAGIYSALKAKSKGWLYGAIVGLLYMVILFLLSLLFNTGQAFDKYVLFRIFMGFVTGALAGIIGINLK